MKLVCALIVASYRKPESFLLKFSTPQEESKWPDPLDGFSSSKLTRTSTSAKGRSIHHLWYLFFSNPNAIDPCSWLTVGLLYILVSVEAESPVAVFQPLSNLVVGIILLRDRSGRAREQNPSNPGPGHRRPIGSAPVGERDRSSRCYTSTGDVHGTSGNLHCPWKKATSNGEPAKLRT
jgi:hypothetical protein